MQEGAAIRHALRRPRVSYPSEATAALRTLSASWGLRVGTCVLPSSAHCVGEAIEKRAHGLKVSWYLCGSSGPSKFYRPAAPAFRYHGFGTAARKPAARPAPAAGQAAASSSLWGCVCVHQ